MSFLSRFLRVANVRASSIVDGNQALELYVTHCNSLFSFVHEGYNSLSTQHYIKSQNNNFLKIA